LFHCTDSSTNKPQKEQRPQDAVAAKSVAAKGVVELFTIGKDSTNLLFNITSLVIISDSTSTIYALDRGAYQIKMFDATGELLKVAGRKGSGPGELQNPTLLAYVAGHLIVSEQFSPRAHVFSMKLQYVNDVSLEGIPVDMTTIADSVLLMTTISTKNMTSLQLGAYSLDKPKLILWEMPEYKQPLLLNKVEQGGQAIHMLWNFANVAARGDTAWLAYIYQNKIVCFKNNELLWEKSLHDFPEYSKMKEGSSFSFPSGKLFRDITVDQSGYSYILTGDYGEQPGKAIIVLSPEGNYVDTLILPYKAKGLVWGGDDRLYAIGEGRIHIHCYRLISETVLSHKSLTKPTAFLKQGG